MRLRNVKGSRETIAANQWVVQNETAYRGNWKKEIFENNNPIHIEIGMGKGQFIMQLAKLNPDVNYIGIEKYSSVLVRALEKMEEYPLPNIRFIRMEAENIEAVFAPEEIDQIYLNFSDPWPKDRHAKRRLTSREFLGRYANIIRKDSLIIFKTDNTPLFDFSLEEAKEAGWTIVNYTYDLHHSEYAVGNIMTEYETKFSKKGNPINRMVITQS